MEEFFEALFFSALYCSVLGVAAGVVCLICCIRERRKRKKADWSHTSCYGLGGCRDCSAYDCPHCGEDR